MKNKVLISSILTIVMCLSVIAGSTFAIFTAKDDVNISITSGEINVVATLDESTLSANIANSGETPTISGDTLNVAGMMPGDSVSVGVKLDNRSNVNIQYRIVLSIDGELAPALTASATIDGVKYSMNGGKTAWSYLDANAAIDDDITVTVSFESSDEDGSSDNSYQGKAASIRVAVEAYQGNATLPVEPVSVEITPADIDASGKYSGVWEDDTVYDLVGDFSGVSVIVVDADKTLTLNGAGATFGSNIRLQLGATLHSVDSVFDITKDESGSVTSAVVKPRVGEYTVTGFNVTAGSISVGSVNTTVNFTDNSALAADFDSSNTALKIDGNTFGGDSDATGGHTRYDGGNNEYGLYIMALNYSLSYTNNTLKNVYSHGFGILGRSGAGEPGASLSADHVTNEITEFSGNSFDNWGVNGKSGRAAIKIWNDHDFAPSSGTVGTAAAAFIASAVDSASENSFDDVSTTNTNTNDLVAFNMYDVLYDSEGNPIE